MWAMSLQRQVNKKISKIGVGTQLFIFQALMFYWLQADILTIVFFWTGLFLFLYQMLVYPILAKAVDHITLVRAVAVR